MAHLVGFSGVTEAFVTSNNSFRNFRQSEDHNRRMITLQFSSFPFQGSEMEQEVSFEGETGTHDMDFFPPFRSILS